MTMPGMDRRNRILSNALKALREDMERVTDPYNREVYKVTEQMLEQARMMPLRRDPIRRSGSLK